MESYKKSEILISQKSQCDLSGFRKLGLSDNTIQALEKKGFTEPTTIQSKVIPLLLKGEKDVVGQSQTGTGKTAGFALPILERIKLGTKKVQAIVLTPTRELAIQVAKEIDSLKGKKKVKILSVYGGSSIVAQIQALKKDGIDIVVGTPGRVMDLQNRKVLKLQNVKFAVLDEADEMLNMGFVDDIETILEKTPEDKSMLLFSATMPKQILKIAKNYMRDYEFIEVEKKNVITENVEQIYYDVNAHDRVEAIKRIIDSNLDFHGIIFCNTKASVDNLTYKLTKLNYSSAALHGDITQSQREKILQKFRQGFVKVLIATDVAARGIDVNDLTHVINFSLPQSPESYVHRIGRTGRAGKKGISITLVIPSERRKLSFVERINKCKLVKHKLPTAKQIIENKESQVRDIITRIIDAHKVKSTKKKTRFHTMAEELIEGNDPVNVVSAVLKYSFERELGTSDYKEISEPVVSKSSSRGGSSSGRGRRSSGRDRSSRGRRRNSGDRRSSGRERSSGSSKREGRSRSNRSSDGGSRNKSRSGDVSSKRRRKKR